MPTQLPKVAFITLGGTIASVPDSDGRDATPQLSGGELFAATPQVKELADIVPCSFRKYPSGDLSPEDIIELSMLIREKIAQGYEGVVITQGTDTLEETSFLLDLLYSGDAPIILTGAMRNPGLPGADGPANVLAAVRVAVSPEARGLGPLVVFNDQIHLPRYVRKMHTSSTGAFHSPNAGPIGWVTEDRVSIPLVPRHRTTQIEVPVHAQYELPRIALIKLGLGSDAALVEAAARSGHAGVVLELFGGGHVPAGTVDTLRAVARQIPVVFSSRTGAGELYRSTYGFPGSERDILSAGLISAGSFDGSKARLILSLLLASGLSHQEMQRRFHLDA